MARKSGKVKGPGGKTAMQALLEVTPVAAWETSMLKLPKVPRLMGRAKSVAYVPRDAHRG